MERFPMPDLERSVASAWDKIEPELTRSVTIRLPRKASLSELENIVHEYRREKNYSSAEYVMNAVDGLKPTPVENTETTVEDELDYIRTYGIEWFLQTYTHRLFDGITCLRDIRYIRAQLSHLKDYE